MTRTTVLIVILVIIGAGIAAAALVSGGGGDGSSSTASAAVSTPLSDSAAQPTVSGTTAGSTQTADPRPASVQVQSAVTGYVQAAEEGDATTLCNLQSVAAGGSAGSGADAAQACASLVGIRLADLPGLTQLKLGKVTVDGTKATVQLPRIGEIRLEKVSGNWRVSGFSAGKESPSGGANPAGQSNSGGVSPG